MNTKQRIIFWSCATFIFGVNGFMMHHLRISIPFIFIVGSTFIAGITLGESKEKWKRDKEFAHIVAERLIGKPENSMSPDPQGSTGMQASNLVSKSLGGIGGAAISQGISAAGILGGNTSGKAFPAALINPATGMQK